MDTLINVRWGIEDGPYHSGGFQALWSRDSLKLESLYVENELKAPVSIYNTHKNADMANRIVMDNYNEFAAPQKLIRGTWFWNLNGTKLVAFHEDVAVQIEGFYQQVKV